MNLSAEEIVELLNLTPHPTCGFVRQTYLSKNVLPKSALPHEFEGDRPAGAVLYFMVTPQTQIKLHKIHSDQMYHFYFGDPLEVLLLYANGNAEVKTMGHDLRAGMLPQLFISGDTFHVSRLPKGAYALLGTTEWPGVEPPDVALGDVDQLLRAYPSAKDQILQFTKK